MADTLKKTSFQNSARTIATQTITIITQKQSMGQQIKFYGNKYHNTGAPNIACYVTFETTGGVTLAKDTTDKNGYYEFILNKSALTPGNYYVKFYGSGTVPAFRPEGDWEVIEVIDADLLGVATLVLAYAPTLAVSEAAGVQEQGVDIGAAEWTTAQLDITSVAISEGKLARIDIYYKQDDQTEFYLLESFSVDSGNPQSAYQLKRRISLYSKPTSRYDFYCTYVGASGEVAKIGGNILKSEANDVDFNGVIDLTEYYEVRELECVNATGSSESGSLPSDFAELRWENIRVVPIGQFPVQLRNGYTGINQNITYNQAQSVTGYVVYMYVTSDSTPPANHYPVDSTSDSGSWYFVAETEKVKANLITEKVRCPINNRVAFWVGMKTAKTDNSSTLDDIKTILKY
jgi:hypothetical protein